MPLLTLSPCFPAPALTKLRSLFVPCLTTSVHVLLLDARLLLCEQLVCIASRGLVWCPTADPLTSIGEAVGQHLSSSCLFSCQYGGYSHFVTTSSAQVQAMTAP